MRPYALAVEAFNDLDRPIIGVRYIAALRFEIYIGDQPGLAPGFSVRTSCVPVRVKLNIQRLPSPADPRNLALSPEHVRPV